MPRIRIPQTGTLIEWPPAAAGRVRVHGTIHWEEPTQAGYCVELSFKRDPFRRLFKQSEFWAYVRHVLCRLGDKWPPTPEDLRTHLTKKELRLVLPVLPTYDPSQLTILQSNPPDKLLRLWGQKIAATLHDSAGSFADKSFHFYGVPPSKPLSRKKVQILDGYFHGVDFRLKINREDLCTVYECLATEEGTSRLIFEITWYLLPTILIDLALRGMPRGPKGVEQKELMVIAKCAVVASQELLVRARTDRNLQGRVQSVLSEDSFAALILKDVGDSEAETLESVQRRLVMVLADRSLRPAINSARIKPLVGRDISEILDPESRRQLADMFNYLPDKLTWWFDLLLGPEGHAARTLKLVR
jgi:hypothetical protein